MQHVMPISLTQAKLTGNLSDSVGLSMAAGPSVTSQGIPRKRTPGNMISWKIPTEKDGARKSIAFSCRLCLWLNSVVYGMNQLTL